MAVTESATPDHPHGARDLAALTGSTLASIVLDRALRVRQWSEGAVCLFGQAAAVADGRRLFDVLGSHRPVVDGLRVVMGDMLAGGEGRTCFVTIDGAGAGAGAGSGALEWHVSAAYADDGQPESLVCHVLDVSEQRRLANELAQLRTRFALVGEGSPGGIWDWDVPAGKVFFSPRWKQLHGFADQDVGDDVEEWRSRVHPDDLDRVMAAVSAHFAGETPVFSEEYRIRRKDGSWHWILDRGLAGRDVSGKVVRMAGSEIDITERKGVEERLASRERQQAAVARFGQFALTCTDLQALFDEAVEQVAHVLGVELAKVLECTDDGERLLLRAGVGWAPGLVGSTAIRAGDNSQAGYTLASAHPVIVDDLRTETRFQGPALLCDHDVVSGISCAIPGSAGRPWGAIGAHVRERRAFTEDDINFLVAIANVVAAAIERHRSVETLQRREAELRELVQGANSAILRWTADGTITFFNAFAERFFGWSAEEAVGQHVGILVPDRDSGGGDLRTLVADIVRHPERFGSNVNENVCRDGRRVWVTWANRAIRDARGEVIEILAIGNDVTSQKQAEDALREANLRKDEFLAMLAHELRNPMAPIRNAVEVLKLPEAPRGHREKAVAIIDRQVRHMVRVVDDLLDVSRITRGRLDLRTERVELREILDHAVEAAEPHIAASGQCVMLSLPPGSVYLDADPVRLAQVFVNLLNNASAHSPPGARIVVEVAHRDGDTLVKVRDSGSGIAPEALPRLFELFNRAGAPDRRPRGGLGIGLWLAKSLVEMHGGCIAAASEGPGRGSEFVVRLPPGVPEAADSPGGPVEQPAPGGLRILVVDDNRDSATSLALFLRLQGHEVTEVHDGRAALEAAERRRPDLVLLDIGMPGLDGYDTCRAIRQRPWGRSVAIYAVTGWGQSEDRRKTADAGFDGHLVKPVDPVVLREVLAGAVRRPVD